MFFVLDLGGSNFRISWSNTLNEANPKKNIVIVKNSHNYALDSAQITKIMKGKSKNAQAIAIAVAGTFNMRSMKLEGANNLSEWVNKPFFKNLKNEFNSTVIVNKDSYLAAFGEAVKNTEFQNDFLYITWGTGVGGAVVRKKINNSFKVEILDWKKNFKDIERFCGGGNSISNFGVTLDKLNPDQEVKLIDDFVNQLEILCNKLKLKKVVLGGGIPAKRRDLATKIKKETSIRKIELIQSKLGDYSALYGGYSLLSGI